MLMEFQEAWEELTAPGAQFAMKEIEVRGIPMRIFESAPPSMRFVWELAGGYADRDYVVFEDERFTYAEADAIIKSLAHHLREEHGVGSGDRVAVAMRNYPEWVFSYWAIISLGAACVGMNAWWTSDEMKYGLADSNPKVLIADSERIERVGPVLDELRETNPLRVIAVRTPMDGNVELPDGAVRWEDVVDPSAAPATLPEADIDPDDDACIFYTSGTTGAPKGAQLTHRGSIHNLLNLAFMTGVAGLAGAKAAAAAGSEPPAPADPEKQNVFMAPTPLFHVTANNCLLHPATISGSKIVLTYKWDAARALELIEREGVTNFSGVPTMTREMLMHPDWQTRDTSTLAGLGGGGAPLQPDLVEKIDKSQSGTSPSTGYGLTETHGIVTANSGALYVAKPASCGRIVPTLDGKLIDEAGNAVPNSGVGELCVRGAVVIKGYLNREESTAEAIQDGWFRTGDIATIDEDGYVFIVDRAKDMVLRGGENIYCSEVETAIYQHEAVAEAAVFGVPDDRLGEIVGVAIVLAPGASLDDAGLREFLAPTLAKFKIPERMWFLGEPLPRNANGKFLKRELRESLTA
ncbi:MAG: long-chain acyl-CoA synthetase [Minisyncoccia bacterium]|jgi:long-chain acyl-CoA synthetase|uniref:class I adenylate-forming enzyme family protein n=1 Tax=uncultured Ilumatobacter sp. TaxID=879968 RepID=UPI00374FA54C|tara:strand:- start:222 stop:1955 length:1734 start_codon:yes stop_codon:yes gene_type:complete